MKHPSFRVADILAMDKETMKNLFAFVNEVVEVLPFADNIVDVELVGSLAFGTSTLGSDIDFNIAMADYNHQIPAKQWWQTPFNPRKVFECLLEFENQTGLSIEIGVVDPCSVKYNVCASTRKFELYNRGRDLLPRWTDGPTHPFPLFIDKPLSTINLLTFDPDKDEFPPTFPQHLSFDPNKYYFVAGKERPHRGRFEWEKDEWEHDVPFWKTKYGERFQCLP
jgi:hypothetical protein